MDSSPASRPTASGAGMPWAWKAVYGGLLAWALVCLGLALGSFPGLASKEALQAWVLQPGGESLWFGFLDQYEAPDGLYAHPLLIGLLKLTTAVLGPTGLAVRLPSVLLAMATCGCVVWLARKIETDAVAPWFYLLLLASHPMFLGYGRTGFGPGTAMLGAVLVWYPLFLRKDAISRRAMLGLLLFGALWTLLAHPTYAVFLVSTALVALWVWSRRQEQALRQRIRRALVALLLLASILQLLWIMAVVGFLRFMLWTVRFVWHVVEVLTGARILQEKVGVYWGLWHSVMVIATAMVVALSLLALFRERRRWLGWGLSVMALSLWLYYLLLPFLHYSRGFGHHMFILLCPFAFLCAAGLSVMPPAMGRGVLTCYVAVSLLAFSQGYFSKGWSTENVRAAPSLWTGSGPMDPEPKLKTARWLKLYARPKATIRTGSFFLEKPLAYYLQKSVGYYWDPEQRDIYWMAWRKEPWILVEFNVRGSPLWWLLHHFRKEKIPFRLHWIRSRSGKAQVVIASSPHATYLPKTRAAPPRGRSKKPVKLVKPGTRKPARKGRPKGR